MKKITVGLTIFVVMAVTGMLILASHKAGARNNAEGALPPQRERTIVRKGGKAPVKIKEVRAKGRVLPTKPFIDGEDWLKGLTVKLANHSGKTVTFLNVQVVFPHPERALKKPGAAVFLKYGDNPFNYQSHEALPPAKVNPALPGDYVELTLSDDQYEAIQPLLVSAGIPDNNT